jgi:Protein of unknown function (DUF4236)
MTYVPRLRPIYMGFYIRKGFNFGPLRLNLSRSGLGASFGVKGARVGVGPRGSYVHMGRGGLYYRQTLHFAGQTPAALPGGGQPSPHQQPIGIDSLQEISSAPAIGILDSSAAQLLQELNRVKRRMDLFPIFGLVGAALSVRLLFMDFQWWLYACDVLAIVGLALLARSNDVTNGTAILNYSFEGDSRQSYAGFQNAFAQLARCSRVWHVEAEGPTSDWKRNAGASSLERRTDSRPSMSRPPKVECNIDVPTLSTGRKSLYFFPDRLLVYDSSGVGAVTYGELNAEAVPTRFIEEGSVPSDAQQVDTTWRYVNRNGGPDRRFNNNRQLPILLYGKMSLASSSGLNELFQYSVPESGLAFTAAVGKLKMENPTAAYNANESADRSSGVATKVLLWTSLGLMIALLAFLPWPSLNPNTVDSQKTEDQARQEFVDGLNQRLVANKIGATAASVDASLTLQYTKEGPKAARRDGVEPFVKSTFFIRVLQPDTEQTLCDRGFRTLSITRNGGVAQTVSLSCVAGP